MDDFKGVFSKSAICWYYFFISSEKIKLDILCDSQLIHIKCQALFSAKNKFKLYKIVKMPSTAILHGTFIRINFAQLK